jgi:uncharacterized protein YidB (DUF937 family)
MGLFDNLAGGALGSLLGGQGGGTQATIVNAVMGLLGNQQAGGLGGLVQQFASKGLGDIVNSWVSTGQNLPVTAQQIQQGLGSDTVKQLASQTGLSADQLSSHLAQILPQLVDKLTPNGQIPTGDIMSKGAELLKGLMK